MIEKLFTMLKDTRTDKKILFISGSGVAFSSQTERDKFWDNDLDEHVLNIKNFQHHPDLLWSWILEKRFQIAHFTPSQSHYAIAKLENHYQENFVLLTNTIDGLHHKAGSYRLIEFRGNLYNNRPMMEKDIKTLNLSKQHMLKSQSGHLIRPDITLCGEKPDKKKLIQAHMCAHQADIVIIAGCSLKTIELKAIPLIAKQQNNAKIIEINSERQCCALSDLYVPMSCEKVLPLFVNLIIDLEKGLKKNTNDMDKDL